MAGTVQGHCFSIYIHKCNILKTLTQLKYRIRTTRNSTTPAGISSLCVTVTTHPYSREQGSGTAWVQDFAPTPGSTRETDINIKDFTE